MKTKYLLGIAILLQVISSPALAFTQSDLVEGGAVWLETTLAIALAFIMPMAFSLQIGRGYFVRVLNKFTLRLGADIWWIAYVLIRDGLIFISFVLGLLVFLPGTFLDYDLAVPFMPLSVLLFGTSLVLKLYFDADDNRNVFRIVTSLIFIGTLLWIIGVVFVTESPVAMAMEMEGSSSMSMPAFPSSVVEEGSIWWSIYNTFSSIHNINLAFATFYPSFVALTILGILGFAHPVIHSRLPKVKRAVSTAPQTTPSQILATKSNNIPGRMLMQVMDESTGTYIGTSSARRREYMDYIA